MLRPGRLPLRVIFRRCSSSIQSSTVWLSNRQSMYWWLLWATKVRLGRRATRALRAPPARLVNKVLPVLPGLLVRLALLALQGLLVSKVHLGRRARLESKGLPVLPELLVRRVSLALQGQLVSKVLPGWTGRRRPGRPSPTPPAA